MVKSAYSSNTSKCAICNFELFHPVAELNKSTWGIYNDDRFFGRSIIKLNSHYTSLEELPTIELTGYMNDIQQAIRVLKSVTGCERVNMAILGNTVEHVHAHLIPRFPKLEPLPGKSPWDDPRNKGEFTPQELNHLSFSLSHELNKRFLLKERTFKTETSLTVSCSQCLWEETRQDWTEEEAQKYWEQHYLDEDSRCCCAAFECTNPRVDMLSQLCFWHDFHGEPELDQ